MNILFKKYAVVKLMGIAIVVLIITLSACEKVVHINLGGTPPQVVVEGAVETNIPPYVILTSTIGFFSTVDLATLEGSFIHGANVQVNDGSKTVTLKEYAIDTANGAKFYVYSVDTTLPTALMTGQVGKSYTLTITYNGTTYSSVTKIPNPKGVDSIWFAKPLADHFPDSALQLFVNYTDPDTPGNYVRYFTRRNSQQFYPSGIFSDEAVNGKTINNLQLVAGYDDSLNVNGDSLRYFYPGDTMTLKWCEIDRGVYNFWNSYIFANNAIGNPFASPINLQTNMTNGAIGVWAGYGSIQYTRAILH